MDRLEQQLRSVLSDERLDVHVSPGAVQAVHDGVRRRKRRNAIVSGAASFALVAAGVGGAVVATRAGQDVVRPGGNFIPPPSTSGSVGKPAPPVADNEIPWRAIPYDASKPIALPGTTPDPSVPPCNENDVTITASEFQGATGSLVGRLTLTNDSDECSLQGAPTVVGYSANDKPVALSAPSDDFLLHPWFRLKNGQQATSQVTLTGDTSQCLDGITRLGVDLGTGGTPEAVDTTTANGGAVKPRCGSVPRDEQLDHYVLTLSDWLRPNGTPTLATHGLQTTIGQQPTSVMQGETVRYQVLLSTGGKSLSPCLPYRQQLVSLDGSQTAYGTSTYLIDCEAMSNFSSTRYVLDMELALTKDVPVGTYALQWQTPIPGLDIDETQQVRVTPAPPRCENSQLAMTPGPTGAATTHYEQVVLIRNTSHATCSLRGFPGITFTNDNGDELRTRDTWTLTSFTWELAYYQTLRLNPGDTVSFALGGPDYDTEHQRPCPSAAGVKVIPPGGSDQLLVKLAWPYCEKGRVDVSPVVPGVEGPR